jgi:hypothetical protein
VPCLHKSHIRLIPKLTLLLSEDAGDGPSEHVHALNMSLGRPYWARLWLVLELVLAKDAVVVCGESRKAPGKSIRAPLSSD